MNATTVNLKQFADEIGVSESTIKRRVQERRRGINNGFPLPLFPEGKKLIWDRQTILDWLEAPSPSMAAEKAFSPPKKRGMSEKQVHQELCELGVFNSNKKVTKPR